MFLKEIMLLYKEQLFFFKEDCLVFWFTSKKADIRFLTSFELIHDEFLKLVLSSVFRCLLQSMILFKESQEVTVKETVEI